MNLAVAVPVLLGVPSLVGVPACAGPRVGIDCTIHLVKPSPTNHFSWIWFPRALKGGKVSGLDFTDWWNRCDGHFVVVKFDPPTPPGGLQVQLFLHQDCTYAATAPLYQVSTWEQAFFEVMT